ncbi:MAG TPA: hypothetical protein VMU95_21420 [Trebonia sp.]|nr:hypothetical protein [Trebonia sp.]
MTNRNVQVPADEAAQLPSELRMADRACCCSARPMVRVLMPPSAGRPHVSELLLCGHHFRASQNALRAAGAIVHSEDGQMIMGPGCPDQAVTWTLGAAPAAASR